MTHSRTSIGEILSARGLSPSRALGQNFVVDPNTVRRIARLSGVASGDLVVEIGAGLGSLTLALVETGAEVVAIEVDKYLIEPLREIVEPAGARVVHADAMDADYNDILSHREATLVANLPYNISTPLVLHLLESEPLITKMLVMVQLEVAERLAANVGDDAYGAASLRVRYHAEAHLVGKVPPSVFLPRPNVDSGLVMITRRQHVAVSPTLVSEDAIFEIVRTAFAQRRKMLRRSLAGVLDEAAFERSGIDPTRRPEELTIDEFAALAVAK